MIKKTLMTIALLAAVFVAGAQATKAVTRDGDTFFAAKSEMPAKSDTLTAYKWRDAKGVEYPIWLTRNCAVYVIRTSKKTGKEYRHYLDREIAREICREMHIEYVEPKKGGSK